MRIQVLPLPPGRVAAEKVSALSQVVSVRLPSPVAASLKAHAARVGRPLSDVVRDLLAEHLTAPSPTATATSSANLLWDDLPESVTVSPVGGVMWDHLAGMTA